MSKILRRPMFRGGGQVSSYGNGITAPLVPGYQMGGRIPGYQMGGNVRGGIVNLPGGYDLTANQRLLENINKDFPNLNVGTSGGSTANLPKIILGSDLYDSGAVAPRPVNIPGVVEEDKTTATEVQDVNDDIGYNLFGELDTITKNEETGVNEYGVSEGPTVEFTNFIEGLTKPGKYKGPELLQKEIDEGKFGVGPDKPGGKDAGSMTVSEIEDLGLTELEKEAQNITESPEISAKDAIRENQELFKELLGSKKARGQDISDMLLRFSGSQGNTLGEKFQNYTRAESAAGPGRGEKINQTAAALAINDYVAGKRSKEQAEVLKGKIDYEYGKKGQMVDVQAGDDVQTALFKIAKKGDVKPNSDAALKYLIGMKDQTANGNKVYRQDKLDIDDLEDKQGNVSKKAKKRLKVGYNIIEEDGVKNIVTWDGTNYNILTIGEIWTG